MHLAGTTIIEHLDSAYCIESQQRQVGQIVVGEGFVVEVRVDQAQPAQTVAAAPVGGEVGKKHGTRVADHDGPDVSTAIQQDADLALDLARDLGKGAGELGRYNALGTTAPGGKTRQPPERRGTEATGVTGQANRSLPSNNKPERAYARTVGIGRLAYVRTSPLLSLQHDPPNDLLAFNGVKRLLGLAQFGNIHSLKPLPEDG